MLQFLKLILPALIPSWRFFDIIAPSPRIEFSFLQTEQTTPEKWQEFRPRPEHISFQRMLKRMVWNPAWNESLFLVSCAERLISSQSEHSLQEISNRIRSEFTRNPGLVSAPYFQFRLILISRHDSETQKETVFVSPVYRSFEDEQT